LTTIVFKYLLLIIKITDKIKIHYKWTRIPFQSIPGVIPVAIPAEFEFWSEFRWNRNYNLAGTSAKIPFPQNSWNSPDSGGFWQEYMGDCKELPSSFPSQMLRFPLYPTSPASRNK
jgi:hypothetical protein